MISALVRPIFLHIFHAGSVRVLSSFAFIAAFPAWLHPSRSALNTAMWALGLVLQTILAWLVFRRRMARSFPGFALLVVFYPLRSAVLFALSGRIESDDYSTLFNALALAEAPLQAFVAIELLLRRLRETGGWTARRLPLALLILCVPFALTALTADALPSQVGAADRVPIFMGFVMLVVFAAICKGSRSANAVRIAGGFACFALFELAGLAGRAHAALYRDTPAFLAWSYVPGAGYLAIVLFWIATLRREARAADQTERRLGIHVVSG
jgi:hypothetical protein